MLSGIWKSLLIIAGELSVTARAAITLTEQVYDIHNDANYEWWLIAKSTIRRMRTNSGKTAIETDDEDEQAPKPGLRAAARQFTISRWWAALR